MEKFLFYAMEGKKMCFLHVLMNAIDLKDKGHEVKIVLEGEACTLPKILMEEENPLYQKALDQGLFAGACVACSKMLNVFEFNETQPFEMLSDMMGHAGMAPYLEDGYTIIAM